VDALKGWHVFRYSFISALASKGVDQRVIDDLVGHSTDEQWRYQHLYPDVEDQAVLGRSAEGPVGCRTSHLLRSDNPAGPYRRV
jgi:integrase